MSSSLMKSLVLLLPVALTTHLAVTAVLVGAAETGQATIRIVLKEQDIPSDGFGVVIFDDIGGFLGPQDGLLCVDDGTMNTNYNCSSSYWAELHGAPITHAPRNNQFGINYDCIDHPGVALYYNDRAKPKERGPFRCTIACNYGPQHTHWIYISLVGFVHIVDMEVSDPALVGSDPNGPIIAGDNVSISVNVTTTPDDTPIPYQWRLNGENVQFNDITYQGVQTNQLTITDVQAEHQGAYTCQVAHSASGTTKPVTLSVISITVQLTSTPTTNDTKIGKQFKLICNLTVVGDDTHQGRATYTWFKDGEQIITMEENKAEYTFNQLEYGNAGHYKCQVAMTFGERTVPPYDSNDFPLTISMVTYQIYLKLPKQEKCFDWTDKDISNKVTTIKNEICTHMTDTCTFLPNTCDLFIKNDSHRGYKCPSKVPHTVSYDVTLQGIAEGNTTVLIDCLQEWIYSDTVFGILVNDVQLHIDKFCCRILAKQSTPECSRGHTFTMSSGLGIGFGVSGVVILLLIAIIVGMVIWNKRRPRHDYENVR